MTLSDAKLPESFFHQEVQGRVELRAVVDLVHRVRAVAVRRGPSVVRHIPHVVVDAAADVQLEFETETTQAPGTDFVFWKVAERDVAILHISETPRLTIYSVKLERHPVLMVVQVVLESHCPGYDSAGAKRQAMEMQEL